jgi:hypothetical protein
MARACLWPSYITRSADTRAVVAHAAWPISLMLIAKRSRRDVVVDGVGHQSMAEEKQSSMCRLMSNPSVVVAVCWSNNDAGANAGLLSRGTHM